MDFRKSPQANGGMNNVTTREGPTTGAWIVIAAYNESAVIAGVLEDLLVHFQNIIVVDDHSSDNTSQVVSEIPKIKLLRHPINLGQGAALQTGIDFAMEHGADFVVTFDADGQHRVVDAVAMVSFMAESQVDVLCGSRFLGVSAQGMSKKKRNLLRMAATFTRLTTGLKVTDAHNGLRVFSRHGAGSIKIRQNRMAHASEIMSQIAKKKLSFQEFPVEIIYSEYSISKGQKLSNSINILFELLSGRLIK